MQSACTKIVDLSKQSKSSSPVYAPFARSILSQSNDLQVVAKTFKELYEHRHRADYDPRERYTSEAAPQTGEI
jgi:hypothetical protein